MSLNDCAVLLKLLKHCKSTMIFKCQLLNPIRLCVTRWPVARQAPLSVGFSRQEYWSGLLCSPPGDLLDPGIEPASLTSLALAGGFFTTSTTQEAPYFQY